MLTIAAFCPLLKDELWRSVGGARERVRRGRKVGGIGSCIQWRKMGWSKGEARNSCYYSLPLEAKFWSGEEEEERVQGVRRDREVE